MIRLLRKIYGLVILALLLVCAILLVNFLRSPVVSTSRPSPNYMIYSIKSLDDEKIEKILAFKTNYKNLGLKNDQIEQIQAALVNEMKIAADKEKNAFLKKSGADLTDIQFFSIDEDGVAGYVIRFPSLDSFNFYYNLLQREVKDGSFVDVMTQTLKCPMSEEEEKEYKNLVTGTIASIAGEEIASKYESTFYFEYVSQKSHVKANASKIEKDEKGYTHYIWLRDKINRIQNLVIKVNLINYWLWVLLGLFLPLGVMCVAIAIVSFNKDLNKRKPN